MRIVGLSPKGKLALIAMIYLGITGALWYFFTKTMLVLSGIQCVAMLAFGMKIKRDMRRA